VGDACFAIVRGAVEITKQLGGKSLVLDDLGPGSFVGQDALVERATRSVTARAVEDTLVIELGRAELRRLLGFHDQVALRLLEQVAVTGIRQLRVATRKLAMLLEARAIGRKPDGSEVTATHPLEQLRAAVREWSVRIEEK
jgi:CRP-like cAMP-binding protein